MTTIFLNDKIEMKRITCLDFLKFNFNVPDYQRAIDHSHVTEIVESVKETTNNFTNQYYPIGVVSIAHNGSTYWCIDGQHRTEAFKKIYDDTGMNISFFCQFIGVRNEDETKEYFNIINKSVPVPALPKGVSLLPISTIVNEIKNKYTKFFTSKGRQRPFLCEQRLTESIGEMVEQTKINFDMCSFMTKLEEYNEELKNKNHSFFKKWGKTNDIENILDKIRERGGLYVGLITDYSWLWNMYGFVKGSEDDCPKANVALNNYVYNRDLGVCKVCQRHLEKEDAQMGHIISQKNGGKWTADNLVVICSKCNQSIGHVNIPDYLSKYKIKTF